MAKNRFQSDQMKHDAVLSEIAPSTETPLDTLFSNINARVVDPLSLSVDGSTRVLSVGHSVITIGPNGKKRALPQLKGVDLGDVFGSIDLADGTTVTGDVQPIVLPTFTGNGDKYIRAGVELRSDKKIYIVWGTMGTTDPATAGAPAFSKSTIASGEILLRINSAGDAFVVPTMANIKQFGVGSGGSGSGSGLGSVNYVDNYDAEIDTSGWARYNDGATATPIDGTGGSVDTGFIFSRTTTDPLRSGASFQLVKPASDVMGHGVSYDLLPFDNVDANTSIITVSFEWADDGNYNNTMSVFLYDKTGAALRTTLGDNVIKAGSGRKVFQFISASTSTSYRLCLHVGTATTVGYTVKFDTVIVGPQNPVESLTIPVYKNAHALSVGNIVSAPNWGKAGASDTGLNRALALVVDVVDSNNFVALMYGRFRIPVNYATGQWYLSDTPGAVVNAKTETSVIPVFVVDYSSGSTSSGVFNPGAPTAETEEGDLSFRPRKAGGLVVSLRGGAIKLSSGDVLVSGSGLFEYTTKVDMSINLSTVYGGTPPDGTYWLYIDRENLPAAVNLSDSGRRVINVSQASNFKLLTTRPDAINPLRYVEVGYFKIASGSITNFGHTPSRYHDQLSDFFSTPEVYKSTTINTETVTDLTHNLSGAPQFVQVYFWDDSASERQPLDASSYVRKSSNTTITIDSNGFTFDSGDYLEVVATYLPVTGNQVASLSNQFESPWFTNTSITTLAHNLSDMEDIKGLCVQEWDTTTGRRSFIPVESLVTEWDNTNLYLNWSGYTPSATLKYRITTGGHALPQSVPTKLGGFTKFVGFGPGSYATLNAAIAASTDGDSILVNRPTALASTLTISANDIKVQFMPNCPLSVSANINKAIVLAGNKISLIDASMSVTGAFTYASLVEVSGDECVVDRARVEVNNAGATITAAYNVTATADMSKIYGSLNKTAGTITSAFTDAGSNTDYSIVTNY